MASFMAPFSSHCYTALRIVVGFLLLWHGMDKLFGFPNGVPAGAPSFVLYVAGPIELVGGFLVMIGLQTRWAAFFCSGLMAFAYWLGHGTRAILPNSNGGELAVLYCFVFLFISAHGSGSWSVDRSRA